MTEKSFHIAKRTFNQTRCSTSPKQKNIPLLPYHENFTYIPQLCKPFNISTVISNTNNVKKILIKKSPTFGACIYKIICKDWDKLHIGQTGKSLETRLKQHKYSVKTAQDCSALFIYLKPINHRIDWVTSSSIASCKSYINRIIIVSTNQEN